MVRVSKVAVPTLDPTQPPRYQKVITENLEKDVSTATCRDYSLPTVAKSTSYRSNLIKPRDPINLSSLRPRHAISSSRPIFFPTPSFCVSIWYLYIEPSSPPFRTCLLANHLGRRSSSPDKETNSTSAATHFSS